MHVILTFQNASKSGDIRKNYFTYDLNGLNVLSKKNDLLHQESYLYDSNDNIVQFTDVNKQMTSFTYDQFGRKVKEIEPQGRIKTVS